MNKLLFGLVFTIYCSTVYSQNIGIGIPTPLERLHVAGDLQIDNLVGNDAKRVYSSWFGTLINSQKVYYYTVNAAQFISNGANFIVNGVTAKHANTSTDKIIAPIRIPYDGKILKLTAFLTDNSSASDLKISLYKGYINSETVTSFQSSGITGDVNISSSLVNYPLFSSSPFKIIVEPVEGGNWDNGAISISHITVEYITD